MKCQGKKRLFFPPLDSCSVQKLADFYPFLSKNVQILWKYTFFSIYLPREFKSRTRLLRMLILEMKTKNVLKNLILLVPFILCVSQSALADVPKGYYSRIDGLKKIELKSAVKACINDGKKTFSYSELWTVYPFTDTKIGTTSEIFDYYNPAKHYFPGNGGNPDGMNKEHACPQSWFNSTGGCYSDLFNVMPSETNANSAKSNYPVGIVKGSPKYSNDYMKVGTSARSEYQGSVFEPCDEFKGDFARIYLYVATMYDQAAWGSKSTVASTCAFTKESYPTLKSWVVDLLLKWHREDPVSEWEIVRNERVYGQQKNRNPYIDYPQLAEYIWGDSTEYAFDLASARINGYGEYIGGGNDTIGTDSTEVDPPTPPFVIPEGTIHFEETFETIAEGGHSGTGESSTPWNGNSFFQTVSAAYQAGGAVRLGTSKATGSMTSASLAYVGNTLTVAISVKGWTTVEGDLKVSLSDSDSRILSYKATISDDFEEVVATFTNVPACPKLKIETTSKRCFIDKVVLIGPESTAIEEIASASSDDETYDLFGRPCDAKSGGLQIRNRKLILIR